MAYAKRYAGGFFDNAGGATPIDSQFLNAVEAALLKVLGVDASAAGQVPIWVPGNSRYEPNLITNANIDPAAAIAKSKLAALNISDADIAAAAGIAASKLGGNIPASKLSGYPADVTKVLRGDGTWGSREIVYVEQTAPVAIPGTTEAGSTTLYDTGTIAYSGAPIILEAWGIIYTGAGFANGDNCVLTWFDSGSPIGQCWIVATDQATHSEWHPFHVRRRYTPTAGNHDFKLNAFHSGVGTGWQLNAGNGTANNYQPMGMQVCYV